MLKRICFAALAVVMSAAPAMAQEPRVEGPRVGARVGVLWTPTYIKSDAAGWWCDPFWGCYLVGNAQYSHQFDISGGITFRF